MNNLYTGKKIYGRGFLLFGIAAFAIIIILGIAGCSVNKESDMTPQNISKIKQEAESTPLDFSSIRREVDSTMEAAMATPESGNGWVDYLKASLELKYEKQNNPQVLFTNGISEENINDIETMINDNASVLELVNRGYEKNYFQPYMEFKKGMASRVPDFLKLRALAYFLALSGDYELNRGNDRQAAVRYIQCVRMGQGMGNNGNLIFGMIGLAIENVGLKPLKKMLNRDDISPDTCAYITGEMDKMNKNHFTMTELIDGEMLYIEYSFDDIIRGGYGEELSEYKGKTAKVREEQAIYEQWYLETREALKGNYREAVDKIAAIKINPENLLVLQIVPNTARAFKRYMQTRTEFEGVMILSAIKEYRAKNGNYPDTLNALSPEFIAEIPEDGLSEDGRFIYKNESAKTVLYSVGLNQKDDDARQAEDKEMENGDMVFIN